MGLRDGRAAKQARTNFSTQVGLISGGRLPRLELQLKKLQGKRSTVKSGGVTAIAHFAADSTSKAPKFTLKVAASQLNYLNPASLAEIASVFAVEASKLVPTSSGSLPVAADKVNLIQGAFVSFELSGYKKLVDSPGPGGLVVAIRTPDGGGSPQVEIISPGQTISQEEIDALMEQLTAVSRVDELTIDLLRQGKVIGHLLDSYLTSLVGVDSYMSLAIGEATHALLYGQYNDGNGGSGAIADFADALLFLWFPASSWNGIIKPVIGDTFVVQALAESAYSSPLLVEGDGVGTFLSGVLLGSLNPGSFFLGVSGGFTALTDGELVSASGDGESLAIGYDSANSQIYADVNGARLAYTPDLLDKFWSVNGTSLSDRSLYEGGAEVATNSASVSDWTGGAQLEVLPSADTFARGAVAATRALTPEEINILANAIANFEGQRRSEATETEPAPLPPGTPPFNYQPIVDAIEAGAIAAGGALSDCAIFVAEELDGSGNLINIGGLAGDAIKYGAPTVVPFGENGGSAVTLDGTNDYYKISATPDMDGGVWSFLVAGVNRVGRARANIINSAYTTGVPSGSGNLPDLWSIHMRRTNTPSFTFLRLETAEDTGARVDNSSEVLIDRLVPFVGVGRWNALTPAATMVEVKVNQNTDPDTDKNKANAVPGGHQATWIGSRDDLVANDGTRFGGDLAFLALIKQDIPMSTLDGIAAAARAAYGLPLARPVVGFKVAPPKMAAEITNKLAIANFRIAPPRIVALAETPSPPANNDFANAISIGATPYSISTTNVAATGEAGEDAHAGFGPGDTDSNSIWWFYSATQGGTLSISLNGSNVDTLVAVYTGTAVDNLTEVASDFDGAGNGYASLSGVPVSAGTDYLIAVDTYTGGQGLIELAVDFTLAVGPGNDNFADATEITTDTYTVTVSSATATGEVDEPFHGDGGGAGGTDARSLWWKYTPGEAGFIAVSLLGSDFDTVLSVYTGASIDNLTPIAENDDGNVDTTSEVSAVPVTGGTTYYIAADGFDTDEQGTLEFDFSFTAAGSGPSNDNFSSPIIITTATYLVSTSNLGATGEVDEPSHAGGGDGGIDSRSLWWSYTPASDGLMSINLLGSAIDTVLAVYTGAALLDLEVVDENDEGDVDSTSQLDNIPVTAGTTYLIAVDGYTGEQGDIEFDFSFVLPSAPANDDFSSATTISSSNYVDSVLTAGATGETGEPAHHGIALGGTDSKSVWYTITPGSNIALSISTTSSSFNAAIAIYTGSLVDALTLVASGYRTLDNVGLSSGTAYYVAIDGNGGDSGDLVFEASYVTAPVPANDNFANAEVVPAATHNFVGVNNIFATGETGEPAHNSGLGAGGTASKSIWYVYTATADGFLVVECTGSGGFDPCPGIYTGAAVNTLTYVGTFYGNHNAYARITNGTTYYIAIDGVAGDTGFCDVQFTYHPYP